MDSSDPRFAARPGVPVGTLRRPSARPVARPPAPGPARADHLVTVRRLKGVAIVATAVTVGAFAGLVVNHPIGTAASSATQPAAGGGSTGTHTNPGVTTVDPFFDPNPGSGGNQAAPAFGPSGGFGGGGGGGGGGSGPAFQSGGS